MRTRRELLPHPLLAAVDRFEHEHPWTSALLFPIFLIFLIAGCFLSVLFPRYRYTKLEDDDGDASDPPSAWADACSGA